MKKDTATPTMILPQLRNSLPAVLLFTPLVGGLISQRASGEPPEYYARLIEEAAVSFVFYDPIRDPRPHRGFTTFHYDVRYRSTYRYWVKGGRIRIEPEIGSFAHRLSNEVLLPESLDHDRRWTDSLVQHEFDHVAMTVDPRVRMLIEQVCRVTPTIVRDLPSGTEVNGPLIDRLIHEVVEPRYQAVLNLLIANENDLDKVTLHGRHDPPDRRAYFKALFTESNLKRHGFPYLADVKSLLRKRAYLETPLPYRFND